jgi:predicted metal-dependent phosphoesterase TrpH
VISPRLASAALLGTGIVLGTLTDVLPVRRPVSRGGYVVLEADLHVHAFLGDGALWPWDLAFEARRKGLDAIAITNHNQVLAARIGRGFSRWIEGPLVLIGEEITAPAYHLIAVGIEETVGWRSTVAQAIEQVHAQGGAAIAAHPTRSYHAAYDPAALRALDGAEVAHPLAYAAGTQELRDFFGRLALARTRPAAIGSSDYHVFSSLGLCRTYVFARQAGERGLVEALRQGQTVAYDLGGMPHGDPELIRLLGTPPAPPADAPSIAVLARLGSICAWLGALGLLLFRGAQRTSGSVRR